MLVGLAHAGAGSAQRPVTLEQAIESALSLGPRIALLRADSLAAAARIATARAYPNPTFSPAYTKSPPQYHLELEQPFEYPFLRAARIRAATLGAGGAAFLAAAERATIRYEVEVAYANAAAGLLIRRLSNRNAAAGQEMLRITRAREREGDASDLDVRLAEVSSGQAQLQALTDSLQSIQFTLELQTLMGVGASAVEIIPADSLDVSFPKVPRDSMAPLRLAAAQQQIQIARANLMAARAGRIPAPALRIGIEWHDPAAEKPNRKLPLIGVALPLPLWDRNRGPIAEAQAAQARATAELALAELQTRNALTLAQQQRLLAQQRVESGRAVVNDAQRVAALSLTAYREGAYTLANVIEAQRNARDAMRSFVEALQASRIAQAAFIRAQIVGGPL